MKNGKLIMTQFLKAFLILLELEKTERSLFIMKSTSEIFSTKWRPSRNEEDECSLWIDVDGNITFVSTCCEEDNDFRPLEPSISSYKPNDDGFKRCLKYVLKKIRENESEAYYDSLISALNEQMLKTYFKLVYVPK